MTTTDIRRWLLVAAAVIVVLQVGDVVSTHMLLARGGVELNPFSRLLMVAGWLLIVKLLFGTGYVLRVSRSNHPTTTSFWSLRVGQPTVTQLCATWMIAGLFLCAVLSNGLEVLQ